MKTSNKILIAASLIVLLYLVAYDMALKAEYTKGDYKQPHYRMQQLSFSNFNAIEHNVGNIVRLRVEKGPYRVWVDDEIKGKLIISQHGQTIQIDGITQNGNNNKLYGGSVIISCPDIISVTTNTYKGSGNSSDGRYLRKNGNSMLIDYHPHATTTVTGFTQAVMQLQANKFTEIELENNSIGELNAKVGDKKHGQAGLTLDADNKIATANLEVPGRSTLTIDNLFIEKMTYQMADSAQVNLTGKATHLLDRR
jgi:hypothetical protein